MGDEVRLEADIIVGDIFIEGPVTLQSGTQLWSTHVGAFSYIGHRTLLGSTRVGRFCSVAPNVVCGWGDHPTTWISTAPVFYSPARQCGASFSPSSEFTEQRPTQIGHDVWIGAGAVIRNGITIGAGAIVGAQAVVLDEVPPYAIVAGVPGRILRYRFDSHHIDRLLAVAWWDFPPDLLGAHAHRWRTDDIAGFLAWAETVRSAMGTSKDQ